MVTTNPWLHFAARRFEFSFSAAESERQAKQEFHVFVHVAGSATRVLWVSQHTTVFDVCCALGGEDAGAERNCLWFETTLARRMDLCTAPHGWVGATAERATKGTALLRSSPTAKEGSSTRCPELSWRRRCRARAAEHVQSYWGLTMGSCVTPKTVSGQDRKPHFEIVAELERKERRAANHAFELQ